MTAARAAPIDPSAPSPIVRWVALFACAFWLHYALVHDVLGLLTVDEIYFAHVFWLIREGLEPYTDFYSNHLPAYFLLLGPLVPPAPDADLSFVWALRAVTAAVIAIHAALLFSLCRRDFIFLFPFLLLFISFGRMAEIRPDTVGLLLFNIAWWQLLRGTGRKNILLAAAFSAAALFFSARAAVMIVGMGLVCLLLCARRKDMRTLSLLAAMGVGLAAIVLLAFLADPERISLIATSVYLDPVKLMPDLTLGQRILSLDRFGLLAMILAAFAAGCVEAVRGPARDLGLVVAGACLTQLALVAFDPSPFQYVYGWSMLPTLAGIGLLGRHSVRGLHAGLAFCAAAIAIGLTSFSLAHVATTGGAPRPGSILRLSYDPLFDSRLLRQAPTDRLVAMMVATEGQQGLWNQLAVLTEICRRIRGPALTKFYANPVCLRDARYDWAGLQWPPLLEGSGGSGGGGAGSAREFEALFRDRPPQLVAWGKHHFSPEPTPWGRKLLSDYEVGDGFALRRDVATGRGGPP